MKREIKFRGKTVKTLQWIFGDLDTQSTQSPRIMFNNSVDNCIYGIEVIPETVGQFTGMHDKNGVEIYEGDTIKLEYETPFGMDGGIGEIVFTNGAFELKLFGDNESAYNISNGSNDDLLVLGNKWDSPNLVERGTDL